MQLKRLLCLFRRRIKERSRQIFFKCSDYKVQGTWRDVVLAIMGNYNEPKNKKNKKNIH